MISAKLRETPASVHTWSSLHPRPAVQPRSRALVSRKSEFADFEMNDVLPCRSEGSGRAEDLERRLAPNPGHPFKQVAWTLSSTNFTGSTTRLQPLDHRVLSRQFENGTRCAETGHRFANSRKVAGIDNSRQSCIPNNLTLCQRRTAPQPRSCQLVPARGGCIRSRTVSGAGCWERWVALVLAIDPEHKHGRALTRLKRELAGHEVVIAGSSDDARRHRSSRSLIRHLSARSLAW